MNVKFAQMKLALDHLRDVMGQENFKNATLEITARDEDPGAGKLCECVIVKCTTLEQPSKYDTIQSPISKDYAVEVFADSENRPPRLTVSVTRDLKEKDGH